MEAKMASTDFNTAHAPVGFGLLHTLTAPLRAIGRGLVRISENSSYMKQVEALNELTDEELAARGTSRADEVRRIFASAGAV
jgi:hypothetical protein